MPSFDVVFRFGAGLPLGVAVVTPDSDAFGYVLTFDQERSCLTSVHVGDGFREDLILILIIVSIECQLDIYQCWRLDLFEQRCGFFIYLVDIADVGERTAAFLCRLAHEVGVWCRTDTDSKQAAVTELPVDDVEQFDLIIDIAIGDEYDLAEAGERLLSR